MQFEKYTYSIRRQSQDGPTSITCNSQPFRTHANTYCRVGANATRCTVDPIALRYLRLENAIQRDSYRMYICILTKNYTTDT